LPWFLLFYCSDVLLRCCSVLTTEMTCACNVCCDIQLHLSSCQTNQHVLATCSCGLHCSSAMACSCASTAWNGMHADAVPQPVYVLVSVCLSVCLCLSLFVGITRMLLSLTLTGVLLLLLRCWHCNAASPKYGLWGCNAPGIIVDFATI